MREKYCSTYRPASSLHHLPLPLSATRHTLQHRSFSRPGLSAPSPNPNSGCGPLRGSCLIDSDGRYAAEWSQLRRRSISAPSPVPGPAAQAPGAQRAGGAHPGFQLRGPRPPTRRPPPNECNLCPSCPARARAHSAPRAGRVGVARAGSPPRWLLLHWVVPPPIPARAPKGRRPAIGRGRRRGRRWLGWPVTRIAGSRASAAGCPRAGSAAAG